MIIDFSPDGVVTALHRDSFDLSFLGKQSIQRATDIQFNEETQLWDMHVRDTDGSFKCMHYAQRGFATYESARRVEVAWLDLCLETGDSPLSEDGLDRLALFRHRTGA